MLDRNERLLGVVTRNELFEVFEQGRGPATKVGDFMLTDPIMVTPDQSPLTVAESMHKHDVDWLPVVENRDSRHLIGIIRSERMLTTPGRAHVGFILIGLNPCCRRTAPTGLANSKNGIYMNPEN